MMHEVNDPAMKEWLFKSSHLVTALAIQYCVLQVIVGSYTAPQASGRSRRGFSEKPEEDASSTQ